MDLRKEYERFQQAQQAAPKLEQAAAARSSTTSDRARAARARNQADPKRLLKKVAEAQAKENRFIDRIVPADMQRALMALMRREIKAMLPHPLRGLLDNYTNDEAPLMASLDAQGQAYWGPAGGGGEWSGRVLDLHGTVIFELDPEASPPVVIGNVYLLIDTTKEGEDAVSFSSSFGAVPRYITYKVGVSDGNGGYTKKSGYVCGDIRVPLILGGDEFSVLTQTEGTGGINMGYLRAIGGSVP